MIELRWRLLPLYKIDDDRPVEVKRVLQFRTQVMQMGNGYQTMGDTIYAYQRPMGMTWSEWQDVPEVQLAGDYALPSPAASHADNKDGK